VGMSEPDSRRVSKAELSSEEAAGNLPVMHPSHDSHKSLVPEALFLRLLTLERKRAERSGRTFLLIVLDGAQLFQQSRTAMARVTSALCSSIRETDLIGWNRQDAAVGIILTELGAADRSAIRRAMLDTLTSTLRSRIGSEQTDQIHISFHFFPGEHEGPKAGPSVDKKLYPEVHSEDKSKRVSRLVKRAIDIVGSLVALVLLSPLLAFIAVAIKLTSKGPVMFRQGRVGQHGVVFQFLKFRSMRTDSDPRMHREFVNEFIRTSSNSSSSGRAPAKVYKITDDPRVTRVGAILRRTSLDELPQFWNVLKGEMSLVGPRPPIPYELESYRTWHKRRIFEVKPGITGLWQVHGRSRTTFDEMVRLDLRYARTWSLLLDLKILIQTPRAIVSGEGAY
jgi:lipopolysaccharide/colanic/teichoic acid biosynthesis glycosyltransferase